MKWVKASERLPEKKTIYHIKLDNGGIGCFDFDGKFFNNGEIDFLNERIFWLDESPTQSQGNGQGEWKPMNLAPKDGTEIIMAEDESGKVIQYVRWVEKATCAGGRNYYHVWATTGTECEAGSGLPCDEGVMWKYPTTQTESEGGGEKPMYNTEYIRSLQAQLQALQSSNEKLTEQRDMYRKGFLTEESIVKDQGERIEELQSSNLKLIDALRNLVELKEWKDKYGKDEHYNAYHQPCWDKAKSALSSIPDNKPGE